MRQRNKKIPCALPESTVDSVIPKEAGESHARTFSPNPDEKSKRVEKKTSIVRRRWRWWLGGEAEESSDLEQHLGDGPSPASCTERNAAQRPLVPVTPTGTTIHTSDLRFANLKPQPERVPEEVRKRARGDRGARVPCCVRERACALVSLRARLCRTHGHLHAGLSESLHRCGAVLNPRCNASKIGEKKREFSVFCYNNKRS